VPDLPDPKLTRFLHGHKRSPPCAGAAPPKKRPAREACKSTAGRVNSRVPSLRQITPGIRQPFFCTRHSPHQPGNKKTERPFYNRFTRICKVPFFPGPVVRSMGATVYGRANRESLYFGDPRPAFCVSLAVYFYRLPAGALRHFGVLLLYMTRHFPNSPNFPKSRIFLSTHAQGTPEDGGRRTEDGRRTRAPALISQTRRIFLCFWVRFCFCVGVAGIALRAFTTDDDSYL